MRPKHHYAVALCVTAMILPACLAQRRAKPITQPRVVLHTHSTPSPLTLATPAIDAIPASPLPVKAARPTAADREALWP